MEKSNSEVRMPQNPIQQRCLADLSYAFVMCELVFSHRSSDKLYEKARKAAEDSINDFFNVCCLVTKEK